MHLRFFLLYGALIFCLTAACPTNEHFLQLCFCQSNSAVSGIVLECSGSDFNQTLESLRVHRSQLGLIQELLLRNSTATRLDAHTFQGLYIKKLDLSGNQIETVDSDAFQGLQNVLQILTLRGNRLRDVPTASLRGLTSLLQLDFSGNDIGNLGSEILYNTPKVFDLNLSGNKICRIHRDSFKNVKHSLQTLNLGENCLDEVPAPAIRGFQQLLALHLHNNQISQIEPLQFMNLPYLSLINLSGNRIARLHRQAFLNVPSLKFMYLSDNQIDALEPNHFRPFEQLELLDLARNRLRTIPVGAFADMAGLTQLYLTGNQIVEIEPRAFANSSLVILLLADNKIFQVSGDMFIGLNRLQQLSLKQNEISLVAQNAFYQLPSLVVVDLSFNNITILQPATFLAQLNLFLLDLSHNQLHQAPYGALNQRVVTVTLHENPLVCTERVHVIQNGVGIFLPGTVDKICGGSGGPDTTVPQLFPELQNAGNFTTNAPAFVIERRPTTTTTTTQPPPFVPYSEPQFEENTFIADEHFQEETSTRQRVITFPSIPPDFFRSTPQPSLGEEELYPIETELITQRAQVPDFGQGNRPLPPLPHAGELPQSQNPFSTPPLTGNDNRPTSNRSWIQTGDNPPVFTFTIPTYQPPVQFITHFPPTVPPFPSRPTPPREPAIGGNSAVGFTVPVATHTIGIIDPKEDSITNQSRGAQQYPTALTSPNQFHPIPSDQHQYPPLQPHLPPVQPNWGASKSTTFSPSATQIGTTYDYPTLPPGIVIADPNKPKDYEDDDEPLIGSDVRTVPPKKPIPRPGAPDAQSGGKTNTSTTSPSEESGSGISASTTIAVCLSVVIVVILIVFVTLCVVRHRIQTKRSESSTSRTSAYVAAQAARVNFPLASASTAGTYGSGKYHHETLPKPPKPHHFPIAGPPTVGPAGNTWIYAPAGYATGNYYK